MSCRRVVSRKISHACRHQLLLTGSSASTLSPSQGSSPVTATSRRPVQKVGRALARSLARRAEATAQQAQTTPAHVQARHSRSMKCPCKQNHVGRKNALPTGHVGNVCAITNRAPLAGRRRRALSCAPLLPRTAGHVRAHLTFEAIPLTCWRIGRLLVAPIGPAQLRAALRPRDACTKAVLAIGLPPVRQSIGAPPASL